MVRLGHGIGVCLFMAHRCHASTLWCLIEGGGGVGIVRGPRKIPKT